MAAALGIALLPKCPMCLAAYLGLFGALGLGAMAGLGWVQPLLIACLIAGAVVAGIGAGRRHAYGPCLVGACAVAAILLGVRLVESPPVVYSGLFALAVALLWERRPVARRSKAC
jgi:hypothetical protein